MGETGLLICDLDTEETIVRKIFNYEKASGDFIHYE